MRRVAAVLAGILLLAACGGATACKAVPTATVFAAASLTQAFREAAVEFERGRYCAKVRFNFGPSNGLATQILEGGPADVFASASPREMEQVASLVATPVNFASASLAVVTRKDSRLGISGLADLGRRGVKVVLAARGVPLGEYARAALAKAGVAKHVLANVVSNEEDAAAVAGKVLLGEADAGIAYAAGLPEGLRATPLSPEVDVPAVYSIAVLEAAGSRRGPHDWVAFVTGDTGRAVLERHGFRVP